jgi:hypothetical protein
MQTFYCAVAIHTPDFPSPAFEARIRHHQTLALREKGVHEDRITFHPLEPIYDEEDELGYPVGEPIWYQTVAEGSEG